MTKLVPVAGVAALPRYAPGQAEGAVSGKAIWLAANESRHGPSPKAVAAYQAASGRLLRYPDSAQRQLRQAIAQHLHLDSERILCGNGSDELVQLAARAFLQGGDAALLSENSFVMAEIYCKAQGAEIVIAQEQGWRVHVPNLLRKATPNTKFCTIANPNNPTGTYLDGSALRQLLLGLPRNCLVLVDEAYAEYATAEDFQSALSLADEFDNLMVTRTFSKIYGLAGLRIGWCYASPTVIDGLQRLRSPFNANAAALAAAEAALADQAFLAQVRTVNAQWRERLARGLAESGLTAVPSQANFQLIEFPQGRGKSAAAAARFLEQRGIFPRPPAPRDSALRITIGLPADNEAVLAALEDYTKAP